MPPFEIKVILIPVGQWTPVVVPFACNTVSIKNRGGTDMRMRTNAAQSSTEDVIPAGFEQTIGAFYHAPQPFRFIAGSTVAFLSVDTGVTFAVLKFLT